MMMTSPSTVSELEALLDEQRQAVNVIRVEYETRLTGVSKYITALELSLELARERLRQGHQGSPSAVASSPELEPGAPADPERDVTPAPRRHWKRLVANLSQIDAAIRVAELTGGTVTIGDLTDIFMEAGLSKSRRRHVGGRVQSLLAKSDRFQRVGPGVYQLVDVQAVSSEQEAGPSECDTH